MNLAIGETTAEQIKMQIGCAMPLMTEMTVEVRGRDLTDGLPRNEKITSSQVEEAIKESISKIVDIVKSTLEKTPPELASDIMEKGIVLAGGGALIKNLDKLLSIETGMPVYVAEEPLDYVACGAALCAESTIDFDEIIENVSHYTGSGNFAFNPPLFKNEEECFFERTGICRTDCFCCCADYSSGLGSTDWGKIWLFT